MLSPLSPFSYGESHTWNIAIFRIADKTILFSHRANAGVIKIRDLAAIESRLMSYSCPRDKFCFPVLFLEFLWSNLGYWECFRISEIDIAR